MQWHAQLHRRPLPRTPNLSPLPNLTPAAALVCSLCPLSAEATHVKEHPRSRSSLLLMALLSGACLFVSLPMCRAASSCHPLQQGRAHPLFYSMTGCMWQTERYQVKWLSSCMLWQPVELPLCAICLKWIWRRLFLWRSSQSVSMRLDDCFYSP